MGMMTPPRSMNFPPGAPTQQDKPAILVVEDHPILSEFMATVALDLGWRVSTAASVCEFGEVLREAEPNVVAIDLGLPDGDGLDLLRQLADAGYQGAVFIVSGFDRDILDQCCELAQTLGLNVIARVQKPISAELLQNMLVEYERENTGLNTALAPPR